MADTLLERAARAVAIASDAETAARASIGQEPFVQDKHREIAKAVLKALREPTGDMLGEAHDAILYAVKGEELDVARSVWERMVDAALAEDEEDEEDWRSEAIHLGI